MGFGQSPVCDRLTEGLYKKHFVCQNLYFGGGMLFLWDLGLFFREGGTNRYVFLFIKMKEPYAMENTGKGFLGFGRGAGTGRACTELKLQGKGMEDGGR